MSKKKAFSGNTMTLKDFHGGSIPSDISLPSAPGVYVFLFYSLSISIKLIIFFVMEISVLRSMLACYQFWLILCLLVYSD